MDPPWAAPVDAKFRVSVAGSGEVIARGHVHGLLQQACRRCLEPLESTFDGDLTLVFVDEEEVDEESEEDATTRVMLASDSKLDLSRAVREEVFLAIEPYVVCRPECRGMCPGCGTNLNDGECTCEGQELDPRWDALRKLKEK
ncbi:MAG: DUF177 domain-containing protein [Gemmatimonadota bacterium]